MGMNDPKGFDSEPFSDHFQPGQPFKLLGAEVVKANSREYGEGEMAVLTILTETGPKDFSIWGVYIVRQIKSADRSDFGSWWTLGEKELPNGRNAKALVPADGQALANAEPPSF